MVICHGKTAKKHLKQIQVKKLTTSKRPKVNQFDVAAIRPFPVTPKKTAEKRGRFFSFVSFLRQHVVSFLFVCKQRNVFGEQSCI